MIHSDDRISFPVSGKLSSSILITHVDLWIQYISFFNHSPLLKLVLTICFLFDSVPVFLSFSSEVFLDESRIVLVDEVVHRILREMFRGSMKCLLLVYPPTCHLFRRVSLLDVSNDESIKCRIQINTAMPFGTITPYSLPGRNDLGGYKCFSGVPGEETSDD